jgi:hypothetical protein
MDIALAGESGIKGNILVLLWYTGSAVLVGGVAFGTDLLHIEFHNISKFGTLQPLLDWLFVGCEPFTDMNCWFFTVIFACIERRSIIPWKFGNYWNLTLPK